MKHTECRVLSLNPRFVGCRGRAFSKSFHRVPTQTCGHGRNESDSAQREHTSHKHTGRSKRDARNAGGTDPRARTDRVCVLDQAASEGMAPVSWTARDATASHAFRFTRAAN